MARSRHLMSVPANKPPVEVTAMDARMDAIRLKEMLGGTLSDQELMCLQIEQNGFGCGTCSSPPHPLGGQVRPSPTPGT